MNTFLKFFLANILLVISVLFPFFSVSAEEKVIKYDQIAPSYKEIQLLGNALSILKFASMNYKDKEIFVYSAIDGMAMALDRYSYFVPPDILGSFVEGLKDKYVGIGAVIARTDNKNIEIISVEPNGPAFKAGIKPKDLVVNIDGRPVNKMSFMEAMKLLRAPGFPVGSKITLTVLRNGKKTPIDFVLVREFIKPHLIEWKIVENGYGYIRLKHFGKDAAQDFKQSMIDMESKEGPLKGLVIDLRNNPGGDMYACIELAKLFINSGIVASLDSNYPEYRVKFKADSPPFYKGPLAIMVDEGSASASELFAGALQFHKRAKVIGRKTFGKGTFQTLVPLSEGGLYITIGKYFTPDGNSVEGIGLTPDIIIDKAVDEATIMSKILQIIKSNP